MIHNVAYIIFLDCPFFMWIMSTSRCGACPFFNVENVRFLLWKMSIF